MEGARQTGGEASFHLLIESEEGYEFEPPTPGATPRATGIQRDG